MEFEKPINYRILGDFITYFDKAGFKEIDLPWTSDLDAHRVTFPDLSNLVRINNEYLVGSAEQAFIQWESLGKLPKGQFMAVTPCFRLKDSIKSKYHRDYFIKLELFINENVSISTLHMMINLIHKNLSRYGQFKTIKTHDFLSEISYDIVSDTGIEIGSYGIRQHSEKRWIYGTGIALPRFTQALNKQ